MSLTPELVEQDDSGKLIRKIVAPKKMITDDLGREFVPPPTVVMERERLAICTLLEQSFYRVVDAIKELLSTLTSDERLGVMTKFEDGYPDKFAQLVDRYPTVD